MPVNLLIAQAIIMTILSLLFIFMPTVDSAFWILTALVAQAYLVMYLLLFAAAIRLRYTRASTPRAYRVPGGNLGMWVVGTLGILSSLFAIIVSFLPPAQIPTGNATFYITFLAIGLTLICVVPFVILWSKKCS
ncbi:MAG: APC family permease [Rhabdochlamydiaceae bacterium]|jgi:amino acid transporter